MHTNTYLVLVYYTCTSARVYTYRHTHKDIHMVHTHTHTHTNIHTHKHTQAHNLFIFWHRDAVTCDVSFWPPLLNHPHGLPHGLICHSPFLNRQQTTQRIRKVAGGREEPYTCTHTHTHIHAHTRSCTHTHTHSRTRTQTFLIVKFPYMGGETLKS